jgi:hypothetical protein
MTRQIPQLLHGMPIVNPDGTPTKVFVDAWNDLLDRTGGQSIDLVGNIINGTQQLTDVNLAGASLNTTLASIDANVTEAATEAAIGSGGLVVTLSSQSAVGSGTTVVITSNPVTAAVVGGVAPYTYTLSKVSGDTIPNTLSGVDNQTVTFAAAPGVGNSLVAQYRWTVEDSTGTPLTASKNFSVSLTRDEYTHSGSIVP